MEGDLVVPIPGLPARLDLADQLPALLAVPIALAVGVTLFLVVLLLVFHPMRDSPAITKAVASIGISLVLLGIARQREAGQLAGVRDRARARLRAGARWPGRDRRQRAPAARPGAPRTRPRGGREQPLC
jgi:branched-subunit amino acid ABC-type transport system permease component